MPVLGELLKKRIPRPPVEVGRVVDYYESEDGEEVYFYVYLPMRKKTLKLKPPEFMLEKIVIPANTFTITIPGQTVIDSAGDTVNIPAQVISFPDADTEINRFDFSEYVGRFALVVNPVSSPRLVGFLSEVER